MSEKRDLAADLEICEAATSDPWIAFNDESVFGGSVCAVTDISITTIIKEDDLDDRPNDLNFVAAAREGWPYAIKLAMELQARNTTLEALLNEAQRQKDEAVNEKNRVQVENARLKTENQRLESELHQTSELLNEIRWDILAGRDFNGEHGKIRRYYIDQVLDGEKLEPEKDRLRTANTLLRMRMEKVDAILEAASSLDAHLATIGISKVTRDLVARLEEAMVAYDGEDNDGRK
jgi:hypothetical protein